MKYSKTTLRELSAKYRSILKKCFLLNAMAMGLIVATNSNAAINVQTGTTDISGDVITTVVANAKLDKAAEAPAVDNPADHSSDSTYGFTKADGSLDNGSNLSTTTAANYQGFASSADGTTVARATTLGYNSGTLAETDYQYKDGQGTWTTYGSGEKTFTDTYTLGQYADKAVVNLTGVNGGTTYALDGTLYKFGVGSDLYTLSADGTQVIHLSDSAVMDFSDLTGDVLTGANASV